MTQGVNVQESGLCGLGLVVRVSPSGHDFFSKDIERQDPTIFDPFSSIFNRHLKRLWTRLAIESIEILQLRPWNPRI